MTVASTNTQNSYTGNGVTTNFAVTFKYLDKAHVTVDLVDILGIATLQVLDTDYTLTNPGDSGTIVMTIAPATGETLVINRVVPLTQGVDYVENDPFPAETHETALDKLTMIAQQNTGVSAGIRPSAIVIDSPDLTFDEQAAGRADKVVGFDASGDVELKLQLSPTDGFTKVQVVESASGRAFNYDDSGAANIYVFNIQAGQIAPGALFDGMIAEGLVANTGTGGTTTINVAGLGVKAIKNLSGNDPIAGEIVGHIELRYDNANSRFVHTNSKILQIQGINVLINGGFDLWQRATSQTAAGYGSDDRWSNDRVGTTIVHSQQTFTLGQTDVPGNPKFFSRTVVTSVAGAANLSTKLQRIEGVSKFAGGSAMLSFFAKADASKNIAIEFIQSFGTGGSPSAEVKAIESQKIPLTTSWVKQEIPVFMPSISGKTLGSNNNDFLSVAFYFDAGSDFNVRTDTLGQQSGTFDIANVKIEKGSVATLYESRHIADEMALAQRYFELGTTTFRFDGSSSGNFGAGLNDSFDVQKRAAPTGSILTDNSSGLIVAPAVTLTNIHMIRFGATFPLGLVAAELNVDWSADSEL